MKRFLVGVVKTFAVIVVVAGIAAFCQQGHTEDKKETQPSHTALMECAKACSDCQRACDVCAVHCTRMLQEGQKEHLSTVMDCRDCATVCSAAAQIVARNGPFSKAIRVACAEICSSCAKECEKFANDSRMKSCADECLKCERACRQMIENSGSTD